MSQGGLCFPHAENALGILRCYLVCTAFSRANPPARAGVALRIDLLKHGSKHPALERSRTCAGNLRTTFARRWAGQVRDRATLAPRDAAVCRRQARVWRLDAALGRTDAAGLRLDPAISRPATAVWRAATAVWRTAPAILRTDPPQWRTDPTVFLFATAFFRPDAALWHLATAVGSMATAVLRADAALRSSRAAKGKIGAEARNLRWAMDPVDTETGAKAARRSPRASATPQALGASVARRSTHGLCLDKGFDYPISRELADHHAYHLHRRGRSEDRPQKTRTGNRTHPWLAASVLVAGSCAGRRKPTTSSPYSPSRAPLSSSSFTDKWDRF